MNGSAAGIVLRLEKSSIYDGEGLRTVLFLKGCPLRCLWCSTPESQRPAPERGLSREKCLLCGRCVKACPHQALVMTEDKIIHDRKKCVGCFQCAAVCPASAIMTYGQKMTAAEAVKEIAKDEIFYFHSGGGLTVSGGEPLDQSGFVREILEGCCERGIDCALESSFYAPWATIEPLLPYISLLHVDIKHPDAKRHRQLTGVDNGPILENIRRADASGCGFDIVVRTPLIPGINDGEEDLLKLAEMVKGLKKLRFMEFLAYHRLGTETYKRLEREYALREIAAPDESYMRSRAAIFKAAARVPVKINGVELA